MHKLLRILIVEDSEDDATLLIRELRRAGYAPTWERVDTADALRAALERTVWDIVIADYSLPGFDGPAALRLVRESGLDLPFIVVSGTTGEDAAIDMMRAGAHDYVRKRNLKHVAAAVARALHEAQARRERAETEQALRESEAKTRAILDTAVDGIITIDEHGTVELFNPAAERIFGYTAEEVIGQNIAMLMPPFHRAIHGSFVANYLRTGQKKIIGIGREVVGQRKDGTTFDMDLAVSEVNLGSRRLFTGVARDISARKRAEQRTAAQYAVTQVLAESTTVEEAVPKLLQSICEGVGWDLGELWRVDRDANVLRQGGMWHVPSIELADFETISREMTFALGVGLPGRVWATAQPAWMNDIVSAPGFVRAALAAKIGLRCARAFPIRSGGVVTGVMAFLVRDIRPPDNDLLQLLDALGRQIGDFLERKRAEAELRELQKRAQQRERLADVGAITAQIVHDLGNPLAGLSMQAQLMLHRANRDPNQPIATVIKPVERILTEVNHLDSLIKKFMDFSREQRLELKTLNLPAFLEEVVDLWRPVAAARRIALTLALPATLPPLQADEHKLRSVFDNLLKNAVEAIDHGPGQIRIQVEAFVPDKVRISVEDTGPGIAPSIQVFRLFETTKPHGSGLGLAIARQIVLAHGGELECAPRQPHGAVFHVQLHHMAKAV